MQCWIADAESVMVLTHGNVTNIMQCTDFSVEFGNSSLKEPHNEETSPIGAEPSNKLSPKMKRSYLSPR